MPNLERILKRRRDADEDELDDLRRVALARLAATNGDSADHPPASDRPPVVVRRINGGTPAGAPDPVFEAEPQAPSPWLIVAPLQDPGEDTAASVESPDADRPTARVDHESNRPVSVASPAKVAPLASEATPVASTDPVPVGPTACCPYCAVRLPQLPETDDRCPRCDQRMIVRWVGARVAILAEAVLPFFEAERHNEERWTRERDRWLELGRERGAGGEPEPDLAGELISEADVAAARAWWMSSVDRAFWVAERDRRWEEAARIRYEQAGVLSSIAGQSVSPSDEIVGLHRDGIAADLQAIGEVAKDAEVRGGSCCEACRVDDHRVVRIAEELRSPTLPHEGCPDGLCRCRWFLTTRDQELLAALLRRQMAADRRTTERAAEPWNDGMSATA